MNKLKYLPEGYLIGSAENRMYTSSLDGLYRAMSDNAICEAPAVLCDSGDYSLRVDLGAAVGIIRREEAELAGGYYTQGGFCEPREPKKIAIITRVGRAVSFKVQRIDTTGAYPIVYLSRRAAQLDCMRGYINGLIPGDIIPARVTHLERFGAFVDIGCGIISLLPVDAVSVSRISHPRERFSPSSRIYVIIKSIDSLTGRINVSHRELLGTWEENAAMFKAGQTVAGIVRSIESYGVFVELTPNLTGLAEPHEDAATGESAAVYIKSISPERMKVKLAVVGAYRGELLRNVTPPKYYVDVSKVKHIDSWRYSPEQAMRVVETVFI